MSGEANRPRRVTMACGTCDVTWMGAPDDDCWSCGKSTLSEVAQPQVVKVATAAG